MTKIIYVAKKQINTAIAATTSSYQFVTESAVSQYASATFNLNIAKSGIITELSADKNSVIRVYNSSSARAADTRDYNDEISAAEVEGLLTEIEIDQAVISHLSLLIPFESENRTLYLRVFNLDNSSSIQIGLKAIRFLDDYHLIGTEAIGLNFGEWDDSSTFTSGLSLDATDSKLILPTTTTAERMASTPILAEILFDTDTEKIYRGDGSTHGGKELSRQTISLLNDGTPIPTRQNLNFKGFKIEDDEAGDTTKIKIADTLTDKAIYWYDDVSKLLKPIPIGTDGQALIAKPALNPPYQFATPSGGREVLTANRTYYVRTDGSDSNNGLSDTAGGAFLTPQKFQDTLVTLDKNGYSVVCQFANGTYTLTSSVLIKDGVGEGEVTLRGNTATPANVVFTSANNIVYFKKFTNTNLNIEGFKFVNTGANNNTVFLGLYAGLTKFKNLDFGAMTTGSNSAQWNMVVDFSASVIPVGNFTISGNARAHALLAGSAVYRDDYSINPPGTSITVTLTGTPAFTQYIDVYGSAVYGMASVRQTFSGSATGKFFVGADQGLISVGTMNLPGNAPGTLSSGAIQN